VNIFLKKHSKVLLIAHRGANRIEPENTLAAFETAIALGSDAIELDVQLTKDDHVVVFHDRSIRRMTRQSGSIAGSSWRQLKTIPLIKKSSTGKTQHISLLRDVLHDLGPSAYWQIELKSFYGIRSIGRRRLLARLVVDTIVGLKLTHRVMIKSFDPYVLREVKRYNSDITCGFLLAPGLQAIRHVGVGRQAFQLCEIIEPRRIDERLIKSLHHANKLVIPWAIDDPVLAQKISQLGIQGIVTNEILLIKKALNNVKTQPRTQRQSS